MAKLKDIARITRKDAIGEDTPIGQAWLVWKMLTQEIDRGKLRGREAVLQGEQGLLVETTVARILRNLWPERTIGVPDEAVRRFTVPIYNELKNGNHAICLNQERHQWWINAEWRDQPAPSKGKHVATQVKEAKSTPTTPAPFAPTWAAKPLPPLSQVEQRVVTAIAEGVLPTQNGIGAELGLTAGRISQVAETLLNKGVITRASEPQPVVGDPDTVRKQITYRLHSKYRAKPAPVEEPKTEETSMETVTSENGFGSLAQRLAVEEAVSSTALDGDTYSLDESSPTDEPVVSRAAEVRERTLQARRDEASVEAPVESPAPTLSSDVQGIAEMIADVIEAEKSKATAELRAENDRLRARIARFRALLDDE